METGRKTIDGKVIEIRKTGNTDMTPYAYSVYAGGMMIESGCTGKDARTIADGLARPISEAWETEMERSW